MFKLTQMQIDMLAVAMQHSAEHVLHIFAAAYSMGDLATIQYIANNYAQHYSAEQVAIMQQCVTATQQYIAEMQTAEIIENAMLH